MYAAYFGLREPPFSITPDTSFFFARGSHHEALNTLLVAVRSGEGFMKVTGEVGTGKTLLCRTLLSALSGDRAFVTAYVLNPYLGPRALLMAVADELRVEIHPEASEHQLLLALNRYLVNAYAQGRRVVLCLDEVQAMPIETLEALRLFSNLETGKRKLLQVVLFGQPELDLRLRQPGVRQLTQRISFACRLAPLNRAEVGHYVAHRLRIAGYEGEALFSRVAVRRLCRASGGIPRLINILAHKAMMAAFGEGCREVLLRHVRLAVADTESLHPAPYRRVAFALMTFLAASVGAWLWGRLR